MMMITMMTMMILCLKQKFKLDTVTLGLTAVLQTHAHTHARMHARTHTHTHIFRIFKVKNPVKTPI